MLYYRAQNVTLYDQAQIESAVLCFSALILGENKLILKLSMLYSQFRLLVNERKLKFTKIFNMNMQ